MKLDEKEKFNRSWWRFVCKEGVYQPSILIEGWFIPWSASKLIKTMVLQLSSKTSEEIPEGWPRDLEWLHGYFRLIRLPDGKFQIPEGLNFGIRYYQFHSSTRWEFIRQQGLNQQKMRDATAHIHIRKENEKRRLQSLESIPYSKRRQKDAAMFFAMNAGVRQMVNLASS